MSIFENLVNSLAQFSCKLIYLFIQSPIEYVNLIRPVCFAELNSHVFLKQKISKYNDDNLTNFFSSFFLQLFGPSERSNRNAQYESTGNPGRSDVFKYDDSPYDDPYTNYFGSRGDQEEDVYGIPGVLAPALPPSSGTNNQICGGAGCGTSTSCSTTTCCTTNSRCYAEKGNRVRFCIIYPMAATTYYCFPLDDNFQLM